MKRWWREKDFIGIIPEYVINKDKTENEIIDMIIQQIK